MTSPAYLSPPPAEYVVPITRGADRAFTLRRTNTSGAAVNFDSGSAVAMAIDIDKATPTVVAATVSGSTAAFRIDKAVADLIKTNTRFRVVLTVGTDETPLIVGRFERHDG